MRNSRNWIGRIKIIIFKFRSKFVLFRCLKSVDKHVPSSCFLTADFLSSEYAVLSYQHENTKRAIIRLEQSARAHMQRVIVSHGALAILYGRHSRHYIKKPEVLKLYYSDCTFGVICCFDLIFSLLRRVVSGF